MGEADNTVEPANQDPEYLHDAHVILCEAMAGGDGKDGNPDDWHEVATELLDALAAHGWHLFNAEDSEALLGAYLLQKAR